MSQRHLYICYGMFICAKNMENYLGLVSILTAENIDTEMCNIILCTYNKGNQIYTLIYTYIFLHVNTPIKHLF